MATDIIASLTQVKEITKHAIEHTEEKAPVIITHPGMGVKYAIHEAAENQNVQSVNISVWADEIPNLIHKAFSNYKEKAKSDPNGNYVLIIENINAICHEKFEYIPENAYAKHAFEEFVDNRPYNMTVIGISNSPCTRLNTNTFEIHDVR